MRGLAVAVAVCLLAPLLLVEVPPLVDYPNHLARLYLLAVGRDDPVLAAMFSVHWGVIPNLAIDVIGPPLLRWLPVHVGGRVLLGLVEMVPFVGVLAFSRALFGRVTAWAVASGLVMGAGAFALGFLNFVVGLGGGLLLAAFWYGWRERRPWWCVAGATVGMAGLFFCHLMGVVFALVLIGAREAGAPRRWWAVVPVVAVPAGLYALAPLGAVPAGVEYLSPAGKLAQVLAPFTLYDLRLDMLTAVCVGGFLLVGAWRGWLEVPRAVLIALGVLAGLYGVAPYAYKGTQSLDTRFVSMFVLLLFAGVRPRGMPGGVGWAAGGVFGVLFAARTGVLAAAWLGHGDDLAGFRQVIAEVPAGAKVFVAAVAPGEAPGYWARVPRSRMLANGIRTDTHLPALLTIERRAFWPLLFDEPSQQPVVLTPAYQALADRNGGMVDHLRLERGAWCGYDFLLLLDAGGDRGFGAPGLTRVVGDDQAALFRVAGCGG